MWNVDRAFRRASQYNLLEKCIGHDCPPCQNLERSGIFHSPRNLEHFASRLYRSRHRTKYLSSARLSFQFEDSFVRLGKNSTTPTTKVLLSIFLVKISFFRCRVSPLINYTPWSVFGIVCTLYQRITLRELGSIQLQVSTARTRREKRKERRKRRKNRGQSERGALHGIKQRWFAVRCKRHGYCASTLGWSIDEVSPRGNAGLLAFNDSAVNFDQPCIAHG